MILYSPTTKKEYILNLQKISGEETSTCPECSDSRKKKTDKCLSYNHEKKIGKCNHCGMSVVPKRDMEIRAKYKKPPKWENKTNLSDKVVKWFLSRGIHQQTLIDFKISEGVEFMPQVGKEINTIQYPIFRDGEVVNIKYRGPKKEFKCFKDAESIFFNIDAIKDSEHCVITEGYEDCMAFHQAGIEAVVSVPNGGVNGKNNLDYVDNCIEYFADKTKIYLATDDDAVGRNLQEQLAERFGKERCVRVKFDGCKDANDCLIKYGAGGLIDALQNSTEFPISGIFTVKDYADELKDIYDHGLPQGAKTKMSGLNELLKFHRGYQTTIGGAPGHGKSSWLDQLCLQLSLVNGWKGAFYSPENKPTSLHISNLSRKLIGKPWWGENRISPKEIEQAKSFLQDRFSFINPDSDFGLDSILKYVKILKERRGIDFYVIDAWNKIEHKHSSEPLRYIGESLDKLANFNYANNLHLFLVAHPRKMTKKKDSEKIEVPSAYDIAGSSDFNNKSDNIISVYRDFDEEETQIHVQKVKFDHWGKTGLFRLKYDTESGRFNDYNGALSSFDRSPWIYEEGDEPPQQTEISEVPF